MVLLDHRATKKKETCCIIMFPIENHEKKVQFWTKPALAPASNASAATTTLEASSPGSSTGAERQCLGCHPKTWEVIKELTNHSPVDFGIFGGTYFQASPSTQNQQSRTAAQCSCKRMKSWDFPSFPVDSHTDSCSRRFPLTLCHCQIKLLTCMCMCDCVCARAFVSVHANAHLAQFSCTTINLAKRSIPTRISDESQNSKTRCLSLTSIC